jgi:molybdopterin synthase catalytic subunit
LSIDLPDGATAGLLTRHIAELHPGVRELPEARVSVNYEYVGDDHPLTERDEVALIPPVSGGSAGHFEVTADELTADSVAELDASLDDFAAVDDELRRRPLRVGDFD